LPVAAPHRRSKSTTKAYPLFFWKHQIRGGDWGGGAGVGEGHGRWWLSTTPGRAGKRRRKAGERRNSWFLKLDIAKAFDSMHWSNILEVLKGFGFGQHWCNLVSLILASISSKVLFNGIPEKSLQHRRGLRKGDPLHPCCSS
jgi:hypothetical protein